MSSIPSFDVLIGGGTVFDPAAGLEARLDVGIRDGRIVALAPALNRVAAAQVIDAAGCYVAPGLVDLHSHVYWGVSEYGVDADQSILSGGVTTTVDAGSSGAANFPGFRRYVMERSQTRILAFVHLAVHGIQPPPATELRDPGYASAERAADTVRANPDRAVGIKIRMSADTVGEHGRELFGKAIRAAEMASTRLMVHIGSTAVPLEWIAERLRPGDIITHCFTPQQPGVLDAAGRVRQAIRHARERGVLFDVGHGRGSFSFEVARAALAQDFPPDTISTDLHAFSRQTPVVDLQTTASKFLALGLSLAAVVGAITAAPAAAIGWADRIGRIEIGREADLAVLELRRQPVRLRDATGAELAAPARLSTRWTIRSGQPVSSQHDA